MQWGQLMASNIHLFIIGVFPFIFSTQSFGQGFGFPNPSRNVPIEIQADNGIEWHKKTKTYIAHGNARAKQGEVSIYADQLTAFFRQNKIGFNEIWRINAEGRVKLVSPGKRALGTRGVYDIDRGIFVLTGKPQLITKTEHLSAQQSLEFWEKKSLAVARGNAIATKGNRKLKADILTAYFKKVADGKTELSKVEAFKNVLVSTPEEIIRAKRGLYDIQTGVVVLKGSVKITRGKDQLNGDLAEVNLKTGISRLLSSNSRKVRGLFTPKKTKPK